MDSKNLTGKTRYIVQKRLFRSYILILQVEERLIGEYDYSLGGYIEIEPYDIFVWRNAKIEDVIKLREETELCCQDISKK